MVDNFSTISPDALLPELLERMAENTRTRHSYAVDKQQQLFWVVHITTVTALLFPLQALGAETSEP
jgi:hypothetical protein